MQNDFVVVVTEVLPENISLPMFWEVKAPEAK